MMRKSKMKRRGGMELVIAFGGPPKKEPRKPPRSFEKEYEESEESEDSVSGHHQSRMNDLEERVSRLEEQFGEEDEEEEEA